MYLMGRKLIFRLTFEVIISFKLLILYVYIIMTHVFKILVVYLYYLIVLRV